MIQTSSAFATANASLNKKPIWILEIAGYNRAFSNAVGLGSFPTVVSLDFVLQIQDLANIGGLGSFPGTLTLPNSTPAGNIIFAFVDSADGGLTHSISDTAGSTWTALYLNVTSVDGKASLWYTVVGAATAPGNQITIATGGNRANTDFIVLEVPALYSGVLKAHTTATVSGVASATTSDGNNLTVPISNSGGNWDLFMVSLISASGVQAAVPLGFLVSTLGHPSNPSQQIDEAGNGDIFAVSGGTATANDWLTTVDDLKITVSDRDGGADLADLIFTVQDNGRQVTADLAAFTFEGKNAALLHGFVGMAISDYATLFVGQVDTVESANANTEYTFTVSDVNLKKLTQKIYTLGDDGFATSSKHPHTIAAHPLDILIDALGKAGVPSSKIDSAKIGFYRDTIFNGHKFTFNLTSAPTAKNFIEDELMKPLGMYIRTNNLGVVTIVSFYPAISGNGSYTPPTPPVMTLTTDSIVGMVLETQADLINQVIFDFDDDGTGGSKFLAEEIVDYDVSIAKYGLVGGQTIQSQGMRSSFQGYFMAALIGRLICLRYGLKTMVLDPLTLFWSACTLEPGDIIAVTHPYIPDRVGGVLGVTAKAFEVMDRNWKFKAGRVELKLLAIDLSKFKQYQITPNAEASYAAASSGDKAQYMFQCDATGHYSTSAVANTLG